jgi:hypothetical protein
MLFILFDILTFDLKKRSLWPSPRIIQLHRYYQHHHKHLLEQPFDVNIYSTTSSVIYLIIFVALSINHPLPLLTTSSSLSAEAPMWMPLTPPSSNAWRLSPEPQSNGWINTSPPLSSSPLSMLFPPLLPPPSRSEWSAENENINNQWKSVTTEPIT